jgi:hypothetical protein
MIVSLVCQAVKIINSEPIEIKDEEELFFYLYESDIMFYETIDEIILN